MKKQKKNGKSDDIQLSKSVLDGIKNNPPMEIGRLGKKTCIIYTGIRKKELSYPEQSLAHQEKVCELYAKIYQIEILQKFGGGVYLEPKDYVKSIDEIITFSNQNKGKIDYLLIQDYYSFFRRSSYEAFCVIKALKENGIRIIRVKRGVNEVPETLIYKLPNCRNPKPLHQSVNHFLLAV
jgi:hypothetical protein